MTGHRGPLRRMLLRWRDKVASARGPVYWLTIVAFVLLVGLPIMTSPILFDLSRSWDGFQAVDRRTEPLVADHDRKRVNTALVEAAVHQDICYGWSVRIEDWSVLTQNRKGMDPVTTRVGGWDASGRLLALQRDGRYPEDGPSLSCRHHVLLEGDAQYRWNRRNSRHGHVVRWTLRSDLERFPSEGELRQLGLDRHRFFGMGRDNRSTFADAMVALPRLMTEYGVAPVPMTPDLVVPGPGDRPDGRPLVPDPLRSLWPACVLLVAVAVTAAVFLVWLRDDRPFLLGPTAPERRRTTGRRRSASARRQ